MIDIKIYLAKTCNWQRPNLYLFMFFSGILVKTVVSAAIYIYVP